ncbi:MAG TPA: RNA 2',3'-cyclic phosphodiesterase, partial [Egibacteraceae bacterium]|nr:RNA 2',3'-cyclic phosphodiesterase [Egibacteraceae bacterium]
GLRRAHPGVRWTDPAGWHLTVVFLGWVPADRVDAVERALGRAAARVPPFTLALTGAAGSFRSGVAWAELEEQPALARLAAAAAGELGAVVELPGEGRPFRAHLTLARAGRRPAEAREVAGSYRGPASRWDVERVVLMRSHLSKSGARYETVGAWPLGG